MSRLIAASLALLFAACAGPSEAFVDPLQVHDLAGLVAEDLEGEFHELEAVDGPVALVFWQTWCASCIREAPHAAAAAREHRGIRFFGVVSGTDEYVDDLEVERIAEEAGLGYPQLRDRDSSISDFFAVKATPTIVVIDADGRIAYRGHELPDDWSRFE